MTGRFGFFNLLTIVLGVSMLRDNYIQMLITTKYDTIRKWMIFPFANVYVYFMDCITSKRYRTIYAVTVEASIIMIDSIVALLSIVVLISSLVAVKNLCNRVKSGDDNSDDLNTKLGRFSKKTSKISSKPDHFNEKKLKKAILFGFAENVYSSLATMYIGCHYGLFANMTKHRDEVIVEVNFNEEGIDNDEDKWIKIDFKYKPGSNMKGPIKTRLFPLFHMPRYIYSLTFRCIA